MENIGTWTFFAVLPLELLCFILALLRILQRPSRQAAAQPQKVKEILAAAQLFPELRGGSSDTAAPAEKLKSAFRAAKIPAVYTPDRCKYVCTEEELNKVATVLKKQRVLGVDIEHDSIHSYTGRICLIQISSCEQTFVIDPILLPAKFVEQALRPAFSDPNIIKVFHDSRSDLKWIRREYPSVTVRNVFDTYHMVGLLGTLKSLGLEKLWQHYCGYFMPTEVKHAFQLSDWTVRPLTNEQLMYAPLDSYYLSYIRLAIISDFINLNGYDKLFAELQELQSLSINRQKEITKKDKGEGWVSAFKTKVCALKSTAVVSELIFKWLWEQRDLVARDANLNPEAVCPVDTMIRVSLALPEDPAEFSSSNQFLADRDAKIVALVEQLKKQWTADPEAMRNSSRVMQLQNQKGLSDAVAKKAKRREYIKNKFTMKKPVYENCRLIAKDGELLCNCDRHKIDWYIKKGLAVLVSHDPPTAKLTFEANGRKGRSAKDMDDDLFYVAHRENVCVVCGTSKDLLRYHIVPLAYRQEMAEEFKTHRSHDVVVLCFACNERSARYVEEIKQELAKKYNAPVMNKHQQTCIKAIGKTKRMVQLLRGVGRKAQKIQGENRVALEARLVETLRMIHKMEPIEDYAWAADVDSVNEDVLARAEGMNPPEEEKNLHGRKVIQQVTDVEEFIKMWRRAFLEHMQPEHMPQGWSVDHRVDRTFGKFSSFHNNSHPNNSTLVSELTK